MDNDFPAGGRFILPAPIFFAAIKEELLFTLNFFLDLVLIFAGLMLFWRFLNRPAMILYALALAVSLYAVNVKIGFTICLSRLLLALLVLVMALRAFLNVRGGLQLRINPVFFILFAATIFVQSLALPTVKIPLEHARQMFIYMSMMAIFIAVLILGSDIKVVVRALRFYLAFGVVQGLVGVYQVVGGLQGWPMYQDFVYGGVRDTITTGNPRNLIGVFWSGADAMPRAFGFLSDASHYGAYLVGVILLALAFLVYNRRDILAYLALFAGGAGLILSLSRSAWFTLIVFGLPGLFYLIRKSGFGLRWIRRPVMAMIFIMALLFGAGLYAAHSGLFDIKAVLARRIETFVSGESSAETHLYTRLMALDAWQSSPLIGVGWDFKNAITGWYSPRYREAWGGSHSHHLDALAGSGIIGLVLEWIFMAIVFRYMWRGLKQSQRGSRERAVLAGVLAAYVAIFLGNFLYHYYLYDFVWFLMGCGVAMGRRIAIEAQFNQAAAETSAVMNERIKNGTDGSPSRP